MSQNAHGANKGSHGNQEVSIQASTWFIVEINYTTVAMVIVVAMTTTCSAEISDGWPS